MIRQANYFLKEILKINFGQCQNHCGACTASKTTLEGESTWRCQLWSIYQKLITLFYSTLNTAGVAHKRRTLKMVYTGICCYKVHSSIKGNTGFLMKVGAKKSFSTGVHKSHLREKNAQQFEM